MATVNTCEEAEIRMEAHPSKEIDGRQRVIIERVTPEIDAGRFAIKRVIGEEVSVEADIFCDGNDVLSALLKFRHSTEENWQESPLAPLVNDRWRGSFVVTELGEYFYTIEAWVNHFRSWRRGLEKKFKAGQDVAVEILRGVELVEAATDRASGSARTTLASTLELLAPDNPLPLPAKIAAVLDENLAALID